LREYLDAIGIDSTKGVLELLHRYRKTTRA
jgi:hypothetical protein